ncbi:MAG TPA: Clp protease N-terminal domain-containing protein [Chthonomonadaceae bacterium]|nr:Clp protease N-terminal domain-containing protein [Chthonomonadaceae bacterium]
MRAWISDLCRFLIHPGAAFAWMTLPNAFNIALPLLLLFALLLGITSFAGERLRTVRKNQFAVYPDHLLKNIAAFAGTTLTCALVATLPTLVVARLLGIRTTFEAVFGLLAFASLPRLLAWLTYPLRNWRHDAYRGWQILTLAALIGTTGLLWLGFQALAPVAAWKIGCALLLPAGLLWVEGVLELRSPPNSLTALYPWRSAAGERVVVFTPRQRTSKAAIQEIVRECDRTLIEVTTALEVRPLPFKVLVFLFGDPALHHRFVGTEQPLCSGYAYEDSISLQYAPWDTISATVAHEFCHVLCEQRIAKDLIGLLDEGLARYVESQVLVYQTIPMASDQAAVRLPIPLRILARPEVFYEWRDAPDTDFTSDACYAHAHAFVGYLIARAGIGPFKELCRAVQKEPDGHPGRRLAEGIREVYGISLKEMERQWRQALQRRGDRNTGSAPQEEEPRPYGWDHFTAWARRAVRRASEEATGLRQSRIAPEHLLLGLVHEPDRSAVIRLLQRHKVSPRRIYQEIRRFAPRGLALSEQQQELAPESQQVIENAYYEARRLGSAYIGTEHLFLGLLHDRECLAGRTLARLGFALDTIRSEIEEVQDRTA